MPVHCKIHNLLLIFLCTALLALMTAGCASKEEPRPELPGQARLATFHVKQDERVLVQVTGANMDCEDFASLVTASLQSRCGLSPAASPEEADLIITIAVKDIYLAMTSAPRMSGSRTLGNTAMGTSLGLAIGSLAGGRQGGLLGAGIGAVLGLSVSAMDAERTETWALSADIDFKRKDEDKVSQPYSTSISDGSISREDATQALGNMLSQDLVAALR